jgi:uncharacterized protein (TIGR02266 family)
VDEPERSRKKPDPPEDERTARILLVDDVRRLIDLMRHYLKRTSCRVLTARNAAEALRTCHTERPDVVFLDASMPGMDGLDACRAMKTDPALRAIPVVMVTLRERKDECLQAGCDDVLAKPVSQEDFLAKVRRFVALRERAESRIPVSLRVEFRAPGGTYTAYTKDLSPHGLFLKTSRPFSRGTRLEMTIHLPRGRPAMTLKGEVRRVVESTPGGQFLPGIGVRLLDLSPALERQIEEFIRERSGA